jgi:DNA-binding MarR family transcriptional regulator
MKDKTIDYILRNTWHAVARMYNEQANQYGATMATGFVLLNLDKEAGTPSTLLAPKLGMEPSSLTRTLKTMEAKGLICRKKNPEDGRGVLIFLTDFGKEKRDLSRETVLKFNEKVRSSLSAQQLQHFTEAAEIITNMIAHKKIFENY